MFDVADPTKPWRQDGVRRGKATRRTRHCDDRAGSPLDAQGTATTAQAPLSTRKAVEWARGARAGNEVGAQGATPVIAHDPAISACPCNCIPKLGNLYISLHALQ